MSRRTMIPLGTVTCHEEAREGLTYAGSTASVFMSPMRVAEGGEVYLQIGPTRDLLIVLQPREAAVLAVMLEQAGKAMETR